MSRYDLNLYEFGGFVLEQDNDIVVRIDTETNLTFISDIAMMVGLRTYMRDDDEFYFEGDKLENYEALLDKLWEAFKETFDMR